MMTWRARRPVLLAALLGALLVHGALGFYGSYAQTYDAYIHMFFADHWVRSWFDHWEPRWYTGFTMTSYPPLSHQTVALLSVFTGDLRTAFVLVQTTAITLMTLGMYRFARLWVDDEAAQWAALWLVCSSAVAETIHVFGQLPTIVSLAFLLNALPYLYRWIEEGQRRELLRSWALIAATTGAHHVTTLFGAVFIIAPVVLLALLHRWHTPLADEPAAHPRYWTRQNWRALLLLRLRRVLWPGMRSALFGMGALALLLLIVWPYWLWTRQDPIAQVPIPHASRDNYLTNPNAGLVFWLIPYGMLLPIFPYIFFKGLAGRTWPLTASIALLALLGTGGTTPLPRLLLRGAFDILTLDRFTFWATVLMLPLAGRFIVSLNRGSVARLLQLNFGQTTWHTVQLGFAGALVFAFILTVSLPRFRPFQPAPIDMQPIINFINKDQHWRWRYLTLGFGDQMAWLSILAPSTQVDGNYHAARRLPELTTTSVERLEGAKFRGVPGIGSLQQFLAVPEKFNLKYIFANDDFYDPLLFFYGWHRMGLLENDVVVWEREDIAPLPEVLPRKEIPLYQRFMFGTLPMAALLAALTTTTRRYWWLPVQFVMEVAGMQQWRTRRAPVLVPLWKRFEQQIWQGVDQRLLAAARLSSLAEGPEPPWQRWLYQVERYYRRLLRAVTPATRRVNLLVLLNLLGILILVVVVWRQAYQHRPQAVVAAYYEDIDFKRFQAAYQRLNPATRPNFEQFILNRSVQGGLLPSYSRLDQLTMTTLTDEADYQQVAVTAQYITALAYYTNTTTLTLQRTAGGWMGGGWTIEPEVVNLKAAPDQFLRRAEVGWLAQGRRRVTSNTTNFADILDRPELEILSARLVMRAPQRFSLVGELLNRDADPADITVTGAIYGEGEELLTWYNAGDGIIHKVLPLEITPFRVDFEGVAGAALTQAAADITFAPGATWDYQLPAAKILKKFTVSAKAVVTQRDLLRAVGVQALRVTVGEAGALHLSGELINNGLQAATVPHLLITLYDAAGEVLWVDHHYLPFAIRPQYTQPFTLALTPAAAIQDLHLPGERFATALHAAVELSSPRLDFIPLPPAAGYRYLRVSVNYFVEE